MGKLGKGRFLLLIGILIRVGRLRDEKEILRVGYGLGEIERRIVGEKGGSGLWIVGMWWRLDGFKRY